jgi:hypothetical protein
MSGSVLLGEMMVQREFTFSCIPFTYVGRKNIESEK